MPLKFPFCIESPIPSPTSLQHPLDSLSCSSEFPLHILIIEYKCRLGQSVSQLSDISSWLQARVSACCLVQLLQELPNPLLRHRSCH
jgi:hypothetical protein